MIFKYLFVIFDNWEKCSFRCVLFLYNHKNCYICTANQVIVPNMAIVSFIYFNKVADLCELVGFKPQHEQITTIDFSNLPPVKYFVEKFYLNFYSIYFMENLQSNLYYGRDVYYGENNSLVFCAPRQVGGLDADETERNLGGYLLAFHPDFLNDTDLGMRIKRYGFFSYDIKRALCLDEKSKTTILTIFNLLHDELEHYDERRKCIVVDYLRLFLDICDNLYRSQFDVGDRLQHNDLLAKLEHLVDDYFRLGYTKTLGKLNVTYCAETLNVTQSYLTRILQQHLGQTTLQYIDNCILDEAKIMLFSPGRSVKHIAAELGFSSDAYFVRWFEKMTGLSPNSFKRSR